MTYLLENLLNFCGLKKLKLIIFSRVYTTNDEVSLCALPLSHAFGLILMLMSLREGAIFVMLSKFNLRSFFEAAERFMVLKNTHPSPFR